MVSDLLLRPQFVPHTHLAIDPSARPWVSSGAFSRPRIAFLGMMTVASHKFWMDLSRVHLPSSLSGSGSGSGSVQSWPLFTIYSISRIDGSPGLKEAGYRVPKGWSAYDPSTFGSYHEEEAPPHPGPPGAILGILAHIPGCIPG